MSGTTLRQYIVLRRDLVMNMGWPVGAVVAQGAHASTAAIASSLTDVKTSEYLKDLGNMHKVVLAVKDEAHLLKTATALEAAGLNFHLWREMPENIPTALALTPYTRGDVGNTLRRLKLFDLPIISEPTRPAAEATSPEQ